MVGLPWPWAGATSRHCPIGGQQPQVLVVTAAWLHVNWFGTWKPCASAAYQRAVCMDCLSARAASVAGKQVLNWHGGACKGMAHCPIICPAHDAPDQALLTC